MSRSMSKEYCPADNGRCKSFITIVLGDIPKHMVVAIYQRERNRALLTLKEAHRKGFHDMKEKK